MTIDDPDVVAELTAAVQVDETALMDNHLGALGGFFWNSARTTRPGVSETLQGFAAIGPFRIGRAGDSPARTQMRVDVLALGADVAVANVGSCGTPASAAAGARPGMGRPTAGASARPMYRCCRRS